MRSWKVYALPIVSALALSACGSSSSSSSSGSSASSDAVKGAKKAPTLAASKGAKGTVTYCTGKDTSGAQIQSVKDFNKQYAAQGLKAKILEFPESADEQRNQFVQRQRAKSGECDIFFSDVIWTAEFAAQKWLLNVTDYVKGRKSEFIPSTLQSGTVGGANFGVPQATDSGLLYYRTDKIKKAPATWQDLYAQAKGKGGVVYQGAAYEGLTVDFLELAFGAGGQVLSSDGKKAVIDSPQNLKALTFMVNGIKSGAAPKAVTTYMEEEAKRAFQSGKPAAMRNWPYAYVQTRDSKVGKQFAVAPLPAFAGGKAAGILGGHNVVISAYSKNPKGALLLTDFITSPKIQKQDAIKYSIAPTLEQTYADPDVHKALPFWKELKQGVIQAKSRPVSAVYPQISEAIYKNVNAALSGSTSPSAALKKAQSDINKALATF
jgi:multiple sugar transport system substrate-binding protein